MAILLDIPIQKITSDTPTPTLFLPLSGGKNRVNITFEEGSTGTITPYTTVDPSNPDGLDQLTEFGELMEITSSHHFIVHGPGYFCCSATSIAGTINILITRK